MSPSENDAPGIDDVIEPEGDGLPQPVRSGHGKMPEELDDDALADATERERVAVGLQDYASADVPPATDPAPPETSEEALRAQQGLKDDDGL
jgi:hypothetical protein